MSPVARSATRADPDAYLPSDAPPPPAGASDLAGKVERLIDHLETRGLIYEPWQVAAFVTAVRTKPLVVLAGVSGTGKTKLALVMRTATGARVEAQPVKPDWTDSSDVLGYEGLTGVFHPGSFLETARTADSDPDHQYFFLLDEMNLARVEYYLAEVLSLIEERERDTGTGTISTPPLMPAAALDGHGDDWTDVRLTGNLALVGSVNMDETTHGFSRKVLDRAFILEFADIYLDAFGGSAKPTTEQWDASDWAAPFLGLKDVPSPPDPVVSDVIDQLTTLNSYLKPVQLQVGYRVRDEMALFCINAKECASSFKTRDGKAVDPVDLAVVMKVLPRIQGGSQSIRRVLDEFDKWANDASGAGRTFPLCAERISIMIRRFDDEGFTSYWL